MGRYDSPQIVNLGCEKDITIKELSFLVARKANFEGELLWDRSRPDGMPRKCLDVSRLKALGYSPKITLEEGIQRTIEEHRKLKIENEKRKKSI